jgi:uncharacterized protein
VIVLTRFLLVALLLLLVARAFWRLVAGVIDGVTADPRRQSGPPDRGVQMVRDPVCGTFLVPSRALTFTDRGVVRYFCSEACRQAYQGGGRPPA